MNPYLPVPTVTADDWRRSAVCTQVDPELMHPDAATPQAWNDALSTCSRCPVRRECLDTALAEEGPAGRKGRWGVRGGLTPHGRWLEAGRRGIRATQTAA